MSYLTVVAGQRLARCLACRPCAPQMDAVQAHLAACLAVHGLQPRQIQTDRAACFLGAHGREPAAVPSRLTLWLAGLGVRHVLLPPRSPYRNGAVERFNGAVEHSWQAEAGGLEALRAVWNTEKPALDAAHRPYRGRAGFRMARVWTLLGTVCVGRRVDRQGKFGLWGRLIWVGSALAGQEIEVRFDASAQRLVIQAVRQELRRDLPLPWLTADWLWTPVPLTHQAAHPPDTSMG